MVEAVLDMMDEIEAFKEVIIDFSVSAMKEELPEKFIGGIGIRSAAACIRRVVFDFLAADIFLTKLQNLV